MGDFNNQIGENCIDTFMYQHDFQSVNNETSFYEILIIPVVFFLTKIPRTFYETETFFTSLSV